MTGLKDSRVKEALGGNLELLDFPEIREPPVPRAGRASGARVDPQERKGFREERANKGPLVNLEQRASLEIPARQGFRGFWECLDQRGLRVILVQRESEGLRGPRGPWAEEEWSGL